MKLLSKKKKRDALSVGLKTVARLAQLAQKLARTPLAARSRLSYGISNRDPACLRTTVPSLLAPGGISVAIIHTTQLPLLFISALGFGPRFRPSGFVPPPLAPQWHPPQVPHCACYRSCTIALNCTTFESRCFMFKIVIYCECNTKPRYLRQKHGGVPHGPRAETEGRNDRIVAKIQTPFRPSERAPFPTPRIFATLCQISALGANSF